MKKYVLSCLLVACCFLFSISQPTYTAASNPAIGQQWDVVMLDPTNFDPGPASANQAWDFSSLPTSSGFPPFQFSILDPVQAPFTDSFPGATHVLKWELIGFPFHQFEKADNQQRAVIGGVVPDDNSFFTMSQYLDDDDAIQYPLTYQKTYNFTSLERVLTFSFAFDYRINGTVNVDAYGSLTLASGTFTDVLRVQIERVQIDSLFFPPRLDTSIQYLWLKEGNAMPLLVYEFSLTDPDEDPSLYYTSTRIANGLFHANSSDIQANIYPQPVAQHAYIKLESPLTHRNLEIHLLDLQGKEICLLPTEHVDNKVLQIEVPPIRPGLYLIQVKDNEGQVSLQKLIKK